MKIGFSLAFARDPRASEVGFAACQQHYIAGWRSATQGLRDLSGQAGDGGRLFRSSILVLLTHQDKTMPGGTVLNVFVEWSEE